MLVNYDLILGCCLLNFCFTSTILPKPIRPYFQQRHLNLELLVIVPSMLWGLHVHDYKRWSPRGTMNNTTVWKPSLSKSMIPLLWSISTYALNQIAKCVVQRFSPAISLWVCSCALIQRSVKHLPYGDLEVTEKLGITIKVYIYIYRLWNSVQLHYLSKEQPCYTGGIWSLSTRNEIFHLEVLVNNNSHKMYSS